jgi:uncharacterized cupin superfamily protein
MPKIDLAKVPVKTGTSYPAVVAGIVKGRATQALGDAGGLTQYGVKLVRLAPGAASAHRHWHEAEDEFVWMVEGELVLVEEAGETVMGPGDAATFKAGIADGHHLVNRSRNDGVFLVVGSRATRERCHYPDVDLAYASDGAGGGYTRKSGEPY